MKKVTIMRGLPGSGKTTWIKKNAPEAWVVSADQFLMEGGKYVWTPARLHEAHRKCLAAFIIALGSNTPHVIVDNTNIRARDFKFYVEEAERQGYEIEIRTLLVDSELAQYRQTHGVPAAQFPKLIARLANPLPEAWQKYEVRS